MALAFSGETTVPLQVQGKISIGESAAQLQALTTELCKDGSHNLPNFEELLKKTLERVSEFGGNICDDGSDTLPALENAAVVLWNKTVLLKTAGAVSNVSIAKLRHLAFKISIFSCKSSKDEMALRKLILMGLKTARAWIDCKQFEKAENVLVILNQVTQTLQSFLVERTDKESADTEKHSTITQEKHSLEEDVFRILTYSAEVYCGQERQEDAMQCVYRAKDLLFRHPKEGIYLSYLCYNFGVSAYDKKHYLHCTSWLRESYDLGKNSGMSNKAKAKTLRLLANAYLDWQNTECLEKALSAVTLANTEYQHPAGLFLKIRVLLEAKKDLSTVKTGVDDFLQHSECSSPLFHSLLLLLQQHSVDLDGCPVSDASLLRYQKCPEYGQLKTAYLSLILKFSSNDPKAFAKETIIDAHNSKEPLDPGTRKQFHIIFWEQAAQAYEGGRYADALDWYNYSLSLHNVSGDEVGQSNLAKLHRNRANCHMALHQLSQAKEALREAQSVVQLSVYTNFLFFKLAIIEADTEAAKTSLQAMIISQHDQTGDCEASSDETSSLLALAAQIALEHKQESLGKTALKSLLETTSDTWQVLKVARCLIRLVFSSAGSLESCSETDIGEYKSDLLSYFRTAHSALVALRGSEDMDKETTEAEASWFTKVAWNLALKCENEPDTMKELFLICYNLLALCKQDTETPAHKKACLLMATAACIQMARSADSHQDTRRFLEEALAHTVENNSAEAVLLDPTLRNDESQVLLLLYEFEALVKLSDPRAEAVLEKALVMPKPEPRTFESLAALAVERPAQQPRLAMRALTMAVHSHLLAQQPDITQCSKDIHKLIELSLACNENEAFTYFTETADMMEKRAEGEYPLMEVVWLMTKAWNTGVRHYCNDRYRQAENWCALSMRFLTHLGSLRLDYEQQMMSLYSEILEGLDRHKLSAD